ncbi:MAG TPA: flagellar hook capping FlgD N-terminal domain-containing protein [Bryobacteraceae bacterium]|nr:flagellar hook capping FlgD N-terminal domain-containing protein [Bryobacteraceae bacterium]HUJ22451.1 flagellar hook capping FlgD N-terminal domain-containing protein [Bryobacteraceae bacterium]
MTPVSQILASSTTPDPSGATAAAGQTGSATSPAGAAVPEATALAQEQTFLQLLVAQLKNQSPDQPTDPTQFVTELAQFSQLEQSVAMRQDLDGIKQALDPGTTSTATPAP